MYQERIGEIMNTTKLNKLANTIINYSLHLKENDRVQVSFTEVATPLVEELIYRKAIFKLLDKKHIVLSYVVSTIVFVLPHMLSTPINNFGDWLLLCVPYFISAILLCLVYHLSKKNVYASWFVHMINNLVTFILILI